MISPFLPPDTAAGGLKLGGTAQEKYIRGDLARGGIRLGGTARESVRYADTAVGGLTMGCQPLPVTHHDTAVGGIVWVVCDSDGLSRHGNRRR